MARFGFKAVHASDEDDTVISIIAYELAGNAPFRAVIWSGPEQKWMYAPGPAASMMFDYRNADRTRNVDRDEAEKLSRALGTSLPTNAELKALCDEGAAKGWTYGPPRKRTEGAP